jgi:hypothetical protein
MHKYYYNERKEFKMAERTSEEAREKLSIKKSSSWY